MWEIVVIGIIEFIIIACCTSIDPYAEMSKKRLKRFIRAILWLVSGAVAFYFAKQDRNYFYYALICAFFVIKYFLDMITPYLGALFYAMLVYGAVEYFVWYRWYSEYPIVVWLVGAFLVIVTIDYWKENIRKIRQGLDADIELEEENIEKEKKKKRKRRIRKIIKIGLKVWRL